MTDDHQHETDESISAAFIRVHTCGHGTTWIRLYDQNEKVFAYAMLPPNVAGVVINEMVDGLEKYMTTRGLMAEPAGTASDS